MPFPGTGRPQMPVGGEHQDRPVVAVATYPDYLSAQRAVDLLSDRQFPVDRVTIVGTGVRLVEKVLGRMTVGKAALAGAGSGLWFGLLIGFLLGIFAIDAWWKVVLFGAVAGIVWGAVFGAIAHAATGGQRDFTSASAIHADTYTLMVDTEHAEQARQLLAAGAG
ncbi:general stress protein [Dactylosporangium sp. AC04546]|uniref:general stress protein n=1 Tax=Dactylosporangium sp. AC04546 TaxID=2862460 RepID=UPI003FA461ED